MGASTGGAACHQAETGVTATEGCDVIWIKVDLNIDVLIRQSEAGPPASSSSAFLRQEEQ